MRNLPGNSLLCLLVLNCTACATVPAGSLVRIHSSPNMPQARGPYSQAVQTGNLLFVAGQPGVDPRTNAVAGADFETQARQAFENLSAVLRASGSSMAHVVKTTIFLANTADFATMNALYAEFFPSNPPARTAPTVQLPAGFLISIEAIAAIPPDS